MNNTGISYLSSYFTRKAIVAFFVVLLACVLIFNKFALHGLWILFGIIEVVGFFFFAHVLTKNWSRILEKSFRRRLFWTSFILRILWVVFSYFFFLSQTGQPFEFFTADALGYHELAIDISRDGFLGIQNLIESDMHFSDWGYPVYLTIVYMVFGKSIIIARLFFALFGAWTSLLVYNLTKRNFDDSTARIAGILVMLLPNLIYYCGLHLKEPLMVFLLVAFIERLDNIFRSRKIKLSDLIIAVLLGLSLFFFRTALGISAVFALFTSLLFFSKRKLSWTKRIFIGFWFIAVISFFFSAQISNIFSEAFDLRNEQADNMKWRAERADGNQLSKFGNSVVFAPIILFAPFPTLINIDYQKYQMMMSGGYFVKNIYSFFVLIALFYFFKQKKYRNHVLILSFIFAYLAILAQSSFAISERFHQPVVPFLLIIAAVGITKANKKNTKYYIPYLVLMSLVIIGWNWFKLAGRGAI